MNTLILKLVIVDTTAAPAIKYLVACRVQCVQGPRRGMAVNKPSSFNIRQSVNVETGIEKISTEYENFGVAKRE